MSEQLSNGAQSTLASGINNAVTSLTVASATGFPTVGPFHITVCVVTAGVVSNAEIMTVTAVSGTTFTVVRATDSYAGTQTALSHSSGETVTAALTATVAQVLVGPVSAAALLAAYSSFR